jgi:hypothetical protein
MNKERIAQVRLSESNPLECFYVYVHRRLSDNKPFYVGKGKSRRAWDCKNRNKHWNNIVDKHGLVVEIVFDSLLETEAFQCEIDTILEFKYFNYELCNYTNGGEGLSGFKWTEEQMINHPSKKNIGRKSSPKTIEKIIKNLQGRPVSKLTREKIRLGQLGKSVFRFMVKTLLKKRVIKHRLRAEILGINKIELYKKPLVYAGFTKEAIQKSADMRRGKPAANAGIPNPKIKGVTNPSADTTSYIFVRKSDGLIFTGTRYDLRDKFDLDIIQLGKLFYSKPRLVSQGWSLLKETNGNTT